MSLRAGAETIVHQCLNIQREEFVVVVDDGNDSDLINALLDVLKETVDTFAHIRYPELSSHGAEPPEEVAQLLRMCDVGIAPTKKSLTHTQARLNACENGARIVTLPGITKEIWNTSLQADYRRVKDIAEYVYSVLENTDQVHITTERGTDLTFDVNMDYFHTDTGIVQEPCDFGNLPAGEADGGMVNANGTLVIDHFYLGKDEPAAPPGTEITIENNRAVDIVHPEGGTSRLSNAFQNVQGARNIAEFGFGTNPQATLIGNLLQDEKVLGTVHIAFGDNTSYIPEGDPLRVDSEIHWDAVVKNPTVRFDDRIMIENGDPIFLEEMDE